MFIYPTIYIKDGHCVKLQNSQNYKLELANFSPQKLAMNYERAGASSIQIVDLDGALLGHAVNEVVIKEIISKVSIPIQVGGGIRTLQSIERFMNLGVDKVIIGTKALENPAFIKEAATHFGMKAILVSIDAKDGMVVTEGWKNSSLVTVKEQAFLMKELGINTIIYTDISREYNLLSPDVEMIKELMLLTGMNVIASGGIYSLKDMELLKIENVYGVLIGNAVHDGRILLKDAIQLFEKET